MSVISSLVLAGSSALFVWGLVHHRSEKFFSDFFSEIEKCQEFDFDYVQKLEDLPTGKLISICAQADNDDASLKPSVFDPKKSVVFVLVLCHADNWTETRSLNAIKSTKDKPIFSSSC